MVNSERFNFVWLLSSEATCWPACTREEASGFVELVVQARHVRRAQSLHQSVCTQVAWLRAAIPLTSIIHRASLLFSLLMFLRAYSPA